MPQGILAFAFIGKISLTSAIVINVPTRGSLALETKALLFLWLAYLNNKSNVCKQISSLYDWHFAGMLSGFLLPD